MSWRFNCLHFCTGTGSWWKTWHQTLTRCLRNAPRTLTVPTQSLCQGSKPCTPFTPSSVDDASSTTASCTVSLFLVLTIELFQLLNSGFSLCALYITLWFVYAAWFSGLWLCSTSQRVLLVTCAALHHALWFVCSVSHSVLWCVCAALHSVLWFVCSVLRSVLWFVCPVLHSVLWFLCSVLHSVLWFVCAALHSVLWFVCLTLHSALWFCVFSLTQCIVICVCSLSPYPQYADQEDGPKEARDWAMWGRLLSSHCEWLIQSQHCMQA